MAEAATALDPRDRAWNDVCELGLEDYVADLDAKGFCVIPPEIANPNNLAERMLAALLDIAEQRNGERPDVVTGATHANRPPLLQGFDGQKFANEAKKEGKDAPPPIMLKEANVVDSPFGDRMNLILYDNEVFAEALMNPPLLALVTYLIGYSAVLSSMGCWMKGPNRSNFPLHSDSAVPEPLPPQAYQAQCTYLLTDFNRENGATCAVPGSHKWCRKPTEREATLLPYEEGGKDQAVLLEAPAGSLAIWHGNTWHGAFNRTAPGLRVSATVYLVRPFIRPIEDYIGKVPQELIDKYGPRLAILLQHGTVPEYSTQSDRVSFTQRARKYVAAYEESLGSALGPKKDLYH